MTAPFAPDPPPIAWVMVAGVPVIVVSAPFARRDDWIGWLASMVFITWGCIFMGMFTYGLIVTGLDSWRGTPDD